MRRGRQYGERSRPGVGLDHREPTERSGAAATVRRGRVVLDGDPCARVGCAVPPDGLVCPVESGPSPELGLARF